MIEPGDNEILLLAGVDTGTGELLADTDKLWQKVEVDKVRDNMQKALSTFTQALPGADATPGFKLTEIEVALTVGAGGEVGFLGTGVSVNASATLTVHLTR